jgi:hypothetical protein
MIRDEADLNSVCATVPNQRRQPHRKPLRPVSSLHYRRFGEYGPIKASSPGNAGFRRSK